MYYMQIVLFYANTNIQFNFDMRNAIIVVNIRLLNIARKYYHAVLRKFVRNFAIA